MGDIYKPDKNTAIIFQPIIEKIWNAGNKRVRYVKVISAPNWVGFHVMDYAEKLSITDFNEVIYTLMRGNYTFNILPAETVELCVWDYQNGNGE